MKTHYKIYKQFKTKDSAFDQYADLKEDFKTKEEAGEYVATNKPRGKMKLIIITIPDKWEIGRKIYIAKDNYWLGGQYVNKGTLYGEIVKENENNYFVKRADKDCIQQFTKDNFESYFIERKFTIEETS